MTNKNLLISVLLPTTIYLILTTNVLADYGQYGQYGQPVPAQTILIDKMYGKPTAPTKGGVINVEYVDNLTPSDPRFKPGAEVMFRLKVKNTSTIAITDVTVKDFVPTYMEPIEGPGTFDSTNRIITFPTGSFNPNEEKTYYVKMQLYTQEKMPADKGLFCLTNKSQVYNNYTSDDDSAQFCVEKQVMGVKKAPESGPEAGILILGANTLLAGIGYGINKLTRKK